MKSRAIEVLTDIQHLKHKNEVEAFRNKQRG